MTKTLVAIIFLILSSSCVQANWYGPQNGSGPIVQNGYYIENKGIGGGASWCSQDGDTAGGTQSWPRAPLSGTYSRDSRAVTSHSATQMRCQRWDGAPPSVFLGLTGGTTSNDTWTNGNVTSTATCSDTGGSACNAGSIQYRRQSSFFACNSGGSWVNGSSYSHTTPVNTVRVDYICYRARDNAGNGYTYSSLATIKIDREPPLFTDITNNVPTNLLANGAYSYNISIGDSGGSPVTSLRYQRENTSNNSLSGNITDSSVPWSFVWDIRNVDNYRLSNGGRTYTYRVNQICDGAGNCTTGIRDYNHNVYANTTSITSSTLTNQLTPSIIADGSVRNISINLQDLYGNDVIPASGISRSVDMNIRGNNALRRDQYSDSGTDSALYAGTNSITVPISPTTLRQLDGRSSIDGNYTVPFYVYGPTNNVDALMPGSANIRIEYDINGSIGVIGDTPQNGSILGSDTVIRAQPLYTTLLSGEIITQGFIEGANQNVNIAVTKVNSTSTTANSLRGEFGDVSGTTNIANGRYGFTVNGTAMSEGQTTWGSTSQLSASLNNLNNAGTLMIQDGPVNSETFSYFASIIKYEIGGRTIIYPGDIFGKDYYHGSAGTNNSYQEGIKIIGNTSSSNTGALTIDQFTDDIRVLGKLTKSTFRQDIDKKAFSVTRNVTAKTSGSLSLTSVDVNASSWNNTKYNVGNAGSRGTALFGETVLYYGDGNITTINGATNIEGQKTIVVENGDLYIAGNIENTDNDGILGIIVINGDILVNTTVTDIHAVLYTNRSIFSSTNGSDRLDGTASSTTLENQLYIRGSLFSENTIGGSRKSTPECPYYVNIGCNQSIAQGYDLNYLRRYYRYDALPVGALDGVPDTPSGAQSRAYGQLGFEDFPIIIDYNPAIQQTPPPFFD